MVDEELDDQTHDDELFAKGGHLSPAGRQAAIRAAFPLVGRYFKQSGAPTLESSPLLNRTSSLSTRDRRLLAALRFRAALSAAGALYDLIEVISLRPTFRYELISVRSADLTGSLNIGKWIQRIPVFDGEPSYPILQARRSASTPENTLASYASLWMLQELEQAQIETAPPPDSPEVHAAHDLHERFKVILARPALRECEEAAAETLRRDAVETLLSRVDSRLRRREIGNPAPYQALLDFVVHYRDNGPDAADGSQLWSFYDETFDTTLFEIWCLHELASTVSDCLATEILPVEDTWTSSGLAYKWSRPAGSLSLYSQRSLTNIGDYSQASKWRQTAGRYLGGIPDMTAVADPNGTDDYRVAVIDAKLRQRSRVPTEEIYKVLGYFNNFGFEESPTGAILYYSPTASEPRIYWYRNSEADGTLLAVELNPADSGQSRKSMRHVAEMLLEMLHIPAAAPDPSGGCEWDEEAAISRHLTEMQALAVQIAPQSLDASRRRFIAMLGDSCWKALDGETQTMLATSDHVGFILEPDADFSGPVLGLCAAIESLLHTHVLNPARELAPDNRTIRRTKTFGSLLTLVERSISDQSHEELQAVHCVLTRSGDVARLTGLLPRLWDMNSDLRIPAAHKERLTDDNWHAAFQTIVTHDKLLGELVEALGLDN